MRLMYGAPPHDLECRKCRGHGRMPTESGIEFCDCSIGRILTFHAMPPEEKLAHIRKRDEERLRKLVASDSLRDFVEELLVRVAQSDKLVLERDALRAECDALVEKRKRLLGARVLYKSSGETLRSALKSHDDARASMSWYRMNGFDDVRTVSVYRKKRKA